MTQAELAQWPALAHIWRVRWTILSGMVLGVLLSFVTPGPLIDALFPIVRMDALVTQKNPTEVVVSLSGSKPWYVDYRNCRYQGVSAYKQVGDLLHTLSMERIDMPATGATKPAGSFNFGTWRIWPTDKTKLVAVYVQYDCDGRDVHVRAAEVAL